MKIGWILLLSLPFLLSQSLPTPNPARTRGRYLTHHVAMCVQCHTPRDPQGNLMPTQLFRGAAMPVRSPFRGEDWALTAPNIAGLTGFTDPQIKQLLTRGRVNGRAAPLPPMPSYRLNAEDADAVIAYLRSL